ncbi:MAG: cell division protein FtsA [Huintestinicola sp.]
MARTKGALGKATIARMNAENGEVRASAESDTAKKTSSGPARSLRAVQSDEDIFALDIGTRNVVGVLGHMVEGVFHVVDAVSVPHKKRAMLDGQIEDINEAAKIVKQVKTQLEDKLNMTLTKVSIAAAGRALKTRRAFVENDIEGKDKITEDMLRSIEMEAVAKAQGELDEEIKNSMSVFYCVGHTVIKYILDDYPIKSLLGHRGKKASVELIAAFLPGLVVESLYTVMDMNDLEVATLTLEPIAAMNVIIPPEVRLINIALVDIGAGTTDIAISQNGSIVAYAMATIAGDEITEEIIRKYLVDFETAEQMKLTPSGQNVEFTDILGFDHSIDSQEFFSELNPTVDVLANTISENILSANGESPAAVFLVGGGSLIPGLPELVAEKLKLPQSRVAIGGQKYQKNVDIGTASVIGPEYVTPIGIGITATLQNGYDFSIITLNGNKMRIFDTKTVSMVDVLMTAGFKSNQIIGRSGRGLTFTLNGERQMLHGELSTPAKILVNNEPVSLEYTVKQGDVIEFTPAVNGMNAAVSISDIAGDISTKKLSVDGIEYDFGKTAMANGVPVSSSYSIQNYDDITVSTIETLDDLIMSLPFDASGLYFYKGEKLVRRDYLLNENDTLVTAENHHQSLENLPNRAREIAERDEKAMRTLDFISATPMTTPEVQTESVPREPAPKHDSLPAAEAAPSEVTPSDTKLGGPITVILNGKPTKLEQRYDNSPHEFLELMALADIDISNPPPSGNMILTLNGKSASFMDVLHEGDIIVIRWDN